VICAGFRLGQKKEFDNPFVIMRNCETKFGTAQFAAKELNEGPGWNRAAFELPHFSADKVDSRTPGLCADEKVNTLTQTKIEYNGEWR
jgi:hypothetical protein